MTDDFDAMYSQMPTPNPRPSFTEKLGRGREEPVVVPAEELAGTGIYRPFDSMRSPEIISGCEIFSWVRGTDVPEGIAFQYRFLMEVTFTGEEMVRLMLPDCVVVIEGKQLMELRRMLMRAKVSFVQEYNPRIWPAPPSGETILDRIEIVRPGSFKTRA